MIREQWRGINILAIIKCTQTYAKSSKCTESEIDVTIAYEVYSVHRHSNIHTHRERVTRKKRVSHSVHFHTSIYSEHFHLGHFLTLTVIRALAVSVCMAKRNDGDQLVPVCIYYRLLSRTWRSRWSHELYQSDHLYLNIYHTSMVIFYVSV